MKKVVRMLGLCALVALAFTSCKKNETNGTVTFKATISQPTSNDRTQIASPTEWTKALYWTSGDAINVFNMAGETSPVTMTGFTEKDATFVGDATFFGNLSSAGSYSAFYPNAQKDGEYVKVTIQPSQAFKWDSFDTNTFPMYGVNDENGNFAFQTNAGVLVLKFKFDPDDYGEDYELALNDIVLTSNNTDDAVAGTLVYNLDGTFSEIASEGRSNTITLDCSGITIRADRWTYFYYVLPEGALSTGFTAQINFANESSKIFTTELAQTIQAKTIRWMGDALIKL